MDNILLKGVVGSTAYGLATPDSDIDRLGVFQRETTELLGLHKHAESVVTNSPDVTLHELGKFVRLCLANNPTVMELLWLGEWDEATRGGDALVEHRYNFLSTRIRNTYGGYAMQQLKRLRERNDGSFSADLRKRTEKHARHCMRLVLQGKETLETGRLRVRLTEEEATLCREAGELAAVDVDKFTRVMEARMAEFDRAQTYLPDEPKASVIEGLLVDLRIVNLNGLP